MSSDRDLLDGTEEVLVETRPHPAVVLPPFVLLTGALAGAVAIGVEYPGAPLDVVWLLVAMVALPALWCLARVVRWRATSFLLTTRRVLYRRGVLRRDLVQVRLQRVAEVNSSQSLLDRMIGRGALVLDVVGGGAPLVVSDLRRPRRLQRVVSAQLDRLEGFAAGARPGGAPPFTPAPPHQSPPVSWHDAPPQVSWNDTPPHGALLETAGASPTSVPDALVQLDQLRRRGLISEAEFSAKKAQLLDRW